MLQPREGQPKGLGIGARRPLQRMDSRGSRQTGPLGAPWEQQHSRGARIATSVVSHPMLSPASAPLGQIPWGSSYLLTEPLFSHLYSGAIPDPPPHRTAGRGRGHSRSFGSRHCAWHTVEAQGDVLDGDLSPRLLTRSLEGVRRSGFSPCITSGARSPGKSLEQAPGRGR